MESVVAIRVVVVVLVDVLEDVPFANLLYANFGTSGGHSSTLST